jgi:CubicO group peptidase (beta-lactamase class C family)
MSGGRRQAELSFQVATPSAFGRPPALDELRSYLEALLADGFPPSVSLTVVGPEGAVLEAFGGYACAYGEFVPTTSETSYDLASLTKVVCTVTLVMVAAERGALGLDDLVTRWLPEYPQGATTLRHLVTHTAGLADHRPFYLGPPGRAPVEAAVLAEARDAVAGDTVVYSDLGYMLLGWVLEACFGESLDVVFAKEVAAPLGLERTHFCPPPGEKRLTAATELDGDQRLRPGLVWGQVHDGNAYALGGVAGHAGLFSPVRELARFARTLVSPLPGDVVSARSIRLMTERQAATGGDIRGLGWRLEPEGWGRWPPRTFWHTGFTGTSLLVAPDLGAAVVLLTNSVHPHRRLGEQAAVRAEVHRLLAEALR